MQSDDQLLAALRSDKQLQQDQALRLLYRRNTKVIRRLIVSRGGRKEEAEEVLQDALVAVYMNARKEGFQLSAKLDTYLYGIAKNIWFKKLRKQSREPRFEPIEEHDTGTVDFVDIILEEEESPLFRAIKKLTQRCSELLTMIFVREMGIQEIQTALGYGSLQAVRNKKSDCLARLRKQLKSGEQNIE